MKPRLYSDLHREFDGWEIPVIDGEEDMTLILAGDIAVARKTSTYAPYLGELAERHSHVVYVPGNHEYYGDSFDRAWWKISREWDFENLHFLQDGETVDIDDVTIVGATLWADMNEQDPATIHEAKTGMNDYRAINRLSEDDTDDGWAYRGKLRPHHTVAEHFQHRESIDNALYMNHNRKTLVVTHHGPTWQSVDPKYMGSPINGAYVSDLSELIRERAPTAWVHGHTHHTVNYTEGKTRVFSNPKGYPQTTNSGADSGYENPNFREDGLVPELIELFATNQGEG